MNSVPSGKDLSGERAQVRPWSARACTIAVFLAVVAYSLLWVWQGFDISDEGYHLVNQDLFFAGRTECPFGMLWLTYMVGGAWLWLTGPLGLLGARLGWVLTMGLTAAVAHRILREYFPARAAAAAVASAAVLSMHHGIMVISQNNIAFLLLLSGAGLLLAGDRRTARGAGRAGCALAGAGGVFLALATMARFPLLPSLGLVLVPPAIRWVQARACSRACLLNVAAAIGGGVATVLICLGGLSVSGHLPTYLHALRGEGLKEDYTIVSLLGLYLRDGRTMFTDVASLGWKAVPWAVGTAVICRTAGSPRSGPLVVAAAGVLWVAHAVLTHGIGVVHWEFFLLMPGVLVTGVTLEMAALLWRGGRSEAAVGRQMLLAFALGTSALIVPGTNNGLLNMIHGLWLLAPAMLLSLPGCVALFAPQPEAARAWRRAALAYTLAISSVFLLFAAANRFVNPFRDNRARWRLAENIGIDRLQGIFTTRGRAEALRPLFLELQKLTAPGETLLAYPSLPMVHFVTRTVPALDNPSPAFIGTSDLKARLKTLECEGGLPRWAVRGSADVVSHKWGSEPTQGSLAADVRSDKTLLLDQELDRLGYRPVWSNRSFVVLERRPLQRPEDGVQNPE